MQYLINLANLLLLCLITAPGHLTAQTLTEGGSADILLRLQKLNRLGSVLYIAAHPDDENTRMLAYFAKGQQMRTAYLSLTRGDGGQNLVGAEQGHLLGLIRTNELLKARTFDGAEQFFTSAIDFGYSKSADETMLFWDKEKVLGDMVWVIRKFRPDVIITRFPPKQFGYRTHGHHAASAILAEEAFDAAGDETRFTEQLAYLQPWQPRSLYWNAGSWSLNQLGDKVKLDEMLHINVGRYNPIIGMSYSEIASFSRTQHKSQGFGAARLRGDVDEYLFHVKGEKASIDPFEAVVTSWDRVEGAKAVSSLINLATSSFDPEKPWKIIPILLDIKEYLEVLEQSYWVIQKQKELQSLIMNCAGIHIELLAEKPHVTPGENFILTMNSIVRNDAKLTLKNLQLPQQPRPMKIDTSLTVNLLTKLEFPLEIEQDKPITQPYWLKENPLNPGTFNIADIQNTGQPSAPPSLAGTLTISINDVDFTLHLPIMYKWTDRVEGELYRQFEIAPPATIAMEEKAIICQNGQAREVVVKIRSWQDEAAGILRLQVPDKWKAVPAEFQFTINEKGTEQSFICTITPDNGAPVGWLYPEIETGGRKYNYEATQLEYDHIPRKSVFLEARAKLVAMQFEKKVGRVAYIMGAGDEIPHYLRAVGYEVAILDKSNFDQADLSSFDAILTGVRAYNTNSWLPSKHDVLMNYVEKGGNLIVQFNTTWGLLTDKIGPYPFTISRQRVSEEDAPVQFIDLRHQLVNYPNKISHRDFDGWIQERGLYFASEWDEQYDPVIKSHDAEEEWSEGGILATRYGKGGFIYTGLSFFRQLPAGVPGAYRLLANMIAYGK